MGVKGLWRLLLPIGRRISIETLEGQILAIDASIWLTQFLTVAARQREQDLLDDDAGNVHGNSNSGTRTRKAYSYDYLVGFLRRLCKLRYQGVRPVLVFDGETPEIKRREIAERLKRRKRKLGGDSFLGPTPGNDEETEAWREATRRMAKRILAKQLRSGTLMTKAQKQRQKQKQAQKQVQPSHKRPKILGSNAAAVPTHISRTSYAPGFYDPDAKRNTDSTTASQKPQQHQHQQHGGSANDDSNEDNGTYRMNNDSSRDNDNDNDDHLLRDDYNSNRLLEEVNDWDAAIVIHSDDEGNGNDNGNDSGNDNDDSDKSNPDQPKRHSYPRTKTGRTKKQKQQEYWDVSKFHAGDGTGFAVDSVADLPETARKDVIEDAQKQRRMASRREFLTVASDPDRLSTCQLRNFLKSTRLNRDIAHMAQKATAKAEEEAKMVRGNGILFEKESTNTNTSTNPASKPKTTHTALGFGGGGRRQHYRAHEAKRNRQTSTKTGSTTRTMRMFHHQKGSQHGTTNNDNDNDNDNSDDEHDFHKVRNAHYLTGGIRFVDSDEHEHEHEHKHKHKHDASESHRKEEQQSSVAAGATLEDGGGGFAVPIADGSNAWTRTCTGSEEDGGEVICIDNDSDNFSDDDSDSHDSGGGGYNTTGREESFLERHNQRNSISVAESETRTASRAEQESQDHALARALQSIEDEANDDDDDDDGNRTPRECIEIDDCSDEDDDCGGGFLSKSPTSRDEAPSDTVVDASRSRDRSQLELDKAQVQEEDDAKLARELQQSEYEEEHKHEPEGCWGDGGGGFLPSTTDHEIEREDGGTSISQANPSKRAGIPSEDDNQKPTLPHEGLRESDPFAGCNSIFAASQQVSAAQTYKDPFAADNSIFGASQQASAAQTHKGELLTCPLTSEDDGDEDDDDDGNVDWEEGDGGGFVTAETSRSNSESSPSLAPQLDKTEGFTSRQPGAAPTTNGELLTCPLSSDEDDEDVDWEDGNDQDKSEEPKTKTNHLPALTSISKHREGLPSSNSSVDDDDGRGRVDWEDGKIQIETMERKTIQPSKDAREKLLFCHSSSNKEDGNQENDGSDGNNVIIWEDDKNNDCNEFDGKKRSSHHETVELSGGSREKEFGVHGSDNDNGDDDEQEDGNSKSRPPRDPEVANVLHAKMYANKLLPVASFKINDHDRTQMTKSIGADETGNEDDDEDDDDAVDWEDGDGECEKEAIELSEDEQPVESPGMVSVSVVTDGRYGGKGDCPDDCEGRKDTLYFAETVRGTSGKPQTVSLNEGKQQETSHTHKQSSKYFDNVAGASMAAEVIDIDDDDDEIDWEAGTTEDALAPIGADDWGTTKTKSSNEVAAALEHAQGTAANLTNWAGRAFRRAIAQHAAENGMEIPESAKPGVLKTKTNDVDEDCLVPSKGKSSVQSESKKPHPSKRKTSDDTIDNSDWLNALDTTNTQGQDFTTVPREAIQSDQMMDPTNSGVTEEMRTEVMQLLRLFGIPYVVAPAEAEAQCVELEKLGLVDGIVTEDSDTFVFGGQVIYKNIFEDKKYVEVYHAKDASEEMNLNQDALVALAMLLGADYTEGVKGVGIVNGMEILQAFDVADDCKAGLTRFRKWLDGFDPLDLAGNNKSVGDITGISTDREQLFHRKHHTARTRWVAPKHFPDIKVLNAYLNPVVDTSRERFSWGIPDLDGLIAFCHGHMGWTADETKKLILPIVQRMEEGSMRQTRIDSFMRYEDGIKFAKIQSKRLRTVLGLSSMETDDRQPRRRKKIDASLKESVCEHKETESDSFNESEEGFASVDLARNQDMMEDNEAPRCEWKKKDNDTQPQPKPQPRRYNGKRTRSLAALSTASASTTAIAVGCTNIAPSNTSIDDPSMSITRHRIVNTNVPKTAPPAYQAHSSTILEEANSNTASSQDCNQKGSSQIYEVINPSMI